MRTPIPKTVWVLGLMMFLMNLSYVMVYSFRGIYLKSILGTSTTLIGVLEGIIEATSFLMKLVSGVITDIMRRRKPLIIIGYLLSILSRPLLASGKVFWVIFTASIMERMGNGIQASPRDAIVADIAPQKRIGACYGLKRSLATIGSFCGAVVGIVAMFLTNNNYQKIFLYASIPPLIALVILFFIKEPKPAHSALVSETPLPAPKKSYKFKISNFKVLGKTFWGLMIVNCIFMAARLGETFLALHGKHNFHIPEAWIPTVMMAFNAGWCLSSYPVGVFADKINRYWFLGSGIVFLVLACLTLAHASKIWAFFLGVFLWGIQYGMTQNVFVSLIAEIVPENLRGTAFGCYWIICATCAFFADTLAGFLAQHYGESVAFLNSAFVGLVSLLLFMVFLGKSKKRVGGG
jgi:MFS family permease